MSSIAVGALAGALASSAAHRMSSSSLNTADENSHPQSSSNGTHQSSYECSNKHVGILGMEVYFPSTFLSQSRLEEHSGVSPGKYTLGLGQDQMALCCGDCEDINSLALTVTRSLLDKYDISTKDVGRLEVGTETLVDKSKSTKTVLMELFDEDCTDVEGATIINACYGGTAALLNAFAWVESDAWDGRYAIVVAADIAAYARGPARPTCGAGAVALLVGRDAPLAFSNPKERVTHASHTWDFYKPDPSVEYPTVDGALSQECYYKALEDCYHRFADKMDRLHHKHKGGYFTATSADYFVFHAPYNKLVQKSYARLFLLDAKRAYQRQMKLPDKPPHPPSDHAPSIDNDDDDDDDHENGDKTLMNETHPLYPYLTKPSSEWSSTYTDRTLDKLLKTTSTSAYNQRLQDANDASKRIGNTYTASVFFGLASLVYRAGRRGDLTTNTHKNVVVFSYGSGCMASMYRLHFRHPTSSSSRFTLEKMVQVLDLEPRLASREEVHPSELDLALETRARMHRGGAPYSPVYPSRRLFPGTFYLSSLDRQWRRTYCRVPLESECQKSRQDGNKTKTKEVEEEGNKEGKEEDEDVHPFQRLAPPLVLRVARKEAQSTPVTGMLSVVKAAKGVDTTSEAKRRIACVITGIAAGLPGTDATLPVFRPENLTRLVEGEQCISSVSGSTISAMVEKRVVKLQKSKCAHTGKVVVNRIPLTLESDVVRLAAQLGTLDLTASYGVPPGLAETMDVAAQVAVAAGMEALKSAGLVRGASADPQEWKLPEGLRDTTGVVYASSFPAMDAAVGEVMRFLQSKTVGAAAMERLVEGLRSRLLRASPERELSEDDEAALARLLSRARETEGGEEEQPSQSYEFDRKFLFRVLVLGNAQLAQLAGCRGPNTQTNAACAGTTQAIAMAQDMLISGRAQRVVVVAGDNASGGTLLPWLGAGFCALGAATTAAAVEDAALPFDKRRSGLLLGAGGIGLVLETESSAQERIRANPNSLELKARLLATQYSNSAFHGAALDRKHIMAELKRFLTDVEVVHGIGKAEIATHGVYLSHETCTHASDASSCAGNEIAALRGAFGDELLSKLLILNTKGFTGHPMGVSFEDVAAVEVLLKQRVPPVSNYKVKDEYLGDLHLSKGGSYACRYALRFAAGFGSQVAFALYSTAQDY